MTDRAALARRWRRFSVVVAIVMVVIVAGAVWPRNDTSTTTRAVTNASDSTSTSSPAATETVIAARYEGMPPVVDPSNIYSEIGADRVSAEHQSDPPRVYVPVPMSCVPVAEV